THHHVFSFFDMVLPAHAHDYSPRFAFPRSLRIVLFFRNYLSATDIGFAGFHAIMTERALPRPCEWSEAGVNCASCEFLEESRAGPEQFRSCCWSALVFCSLSH